MTTFHVQNLGCKVNRVQSDTIDAQLRALGAEPADRDQAELIIVNSCTVTGEADTKTRKAVRQAVRAPRSPMVIVTGCAAAIVPDELAAIDPRVIVEPDKSKVAVRAAELLGLNAGHAPGEADVELASRSAAEHANGEADIERASRSAAEHANCEADIERASQGALVHPRAEAGFPTRMGIMVQDGCDNACTYCIVHIARGKSSSRDADAVVDEVMRASRSGVREIVLTGINIGSYLACDGVPTNLVTLLGRLLDETDIGRIRISSIEPLDVSTQLIDAIVASRGRICAHLHLPLQSGNDKVLSEMDRPYTAGVYLQIVEQLRAKLPALALTTDVIVGFPGESESNFADTLEVCRTVGFSKIHAFRYSPREGTPAALRSDQVNPAVKKERAARLGELGRALRHADCLARVGCIETVLVESDGIGKSESYHDVRLAGTGADVGALVRTRLTALGDDGVFEGEVLERL